jgi:hypothetical protein
MSTTPRLDVGRWVPNLQMYAHGDVTTTEVTIPGARGAAKDLLKNERTTPMIVRAFSATWNWVEPRASTTDPVAFDVRVRSRRVGTYALSPNGRQYAPGTNYVTGLYGTLGSAPNPHVYKLAAPCRVEPGQTIMIESGNVSSEEIFIFTTTITSDPINHMFHCRGARTGRLVLLGASHTHSGSIKSFTDVHTNLYDEPLDILSLTIWSGKNSTDRPLVSIETGGHRWTQGERPLWLFCDPFQHSRILFDRLPEGGLVLEPDDAFEVTVRNPQYSDGGGYNNLYLTLGIEAYQQVAP